MGIVDWLVVLIDFLCLLAAYLMKGGILGFDWAGIAVLQADGQRASRLRCLWRAILSWAFFAIPVVITGVGVAVASFKLLWLGLGIVGLGIALLAGFLVLLLRNPAHAPHDFLAGTYLVPN
jgi:hypothetical protein